MSNLGSYQTITTLVKTLGGPNKAFQKFTVLLAAGSLVVFRAGVNQGAKHPDKKTFEAEFIDKFRRKGREENPVMTNPVNTDMNYKSDLTLHDDDTSPVDRDMEKINAINSANDISLSTIKNH